MNWEMDNLIKLRKMVSKLPAEDVRYLERIVKFELWKRNAEAGNSGSRHIQHPKQGKEQ